MPTASKNLNIIEWSEWQKGVNYIWQSVDAILLKKFLYLKQMFEAKLLIKDFHLSVFQNVC